MKCEVALLTRTIKIQGADGSWEDRYGGLFPLLLIIKSYSFLGHTMVTGD